MIGKLITDILAFVGALTVLVALAGITLNWILYQNWYGESAEQKRRRIRRERAEWNRQ